MRAHPRAELRAVPVGPERAVREPVERVVLLHVPVVRQRVRLVLERLFALQVLLLVAPLQHNMYCSV